MHLAANLFLLKAEWECVKELLQHFVLFSMKKLEKIGRRGQQKDQLQPDVQAENSSYWEWTEAF